MPVPNGAPHRTHYELSSALEDRARPVLNLIDDLRKIGIQKAIPIPQIAVMGDQSSGKSSVLESISGIAFPRGAGLCTRCPTQVTMSRGATWSAEISTVTHRPPNPNSENVYHLKAGQEAQIPEIIEKLTHRLAGEKSAGGFSESDEYIEIKLISPDVPDLTIIDLPGIVRTSTRGQSEMVKSQVDGMLQRFLQQERTIILAVIPAPVDIATVDILERASKVDPQGIRTIGVLTKPDLVNPGAEGEVIEVLANRAKPLLHGYFMLKNRSQEELNVSESADEARERERIWLENSKYADVAGVSGSRLGVTALTSALTQLLVQRIEDVIPSITAEVHQILQSAHKELKSLGKPPPTNPGDCRALAGALIRKFCRKLRIAAESTPAVGQSSELSPSVLQRERQFRRKLIAAVNDSKPGWDGERDSFAVEVTEVNSFGLLEPGVKTMELGEVIEGFVWSPPRTITRIGDEVPFNYPKHGFSRGKIIRLSYYFRGDLAERIEERRGRELPGFMSFQVFTDLVAECVERWKEPTEEFQAAVCEALKETALNLADEIASEWPFLLQEMKDEFLVHLDEAKIKTSKELARLLHLEKMPSTENQTLWDTINKIRDNRLLEKLKAKQLENQKLVHIDTVCALLKSDLGISSNESQEVQNMIDMLKAYWDLAKKRYVDNVAMVVSEAYTKSGRIDAIETRLLRILVDTPDEFTLKRLFATNMMKEKRRAELEQTIKSMTKARSRLRKGIEQCD